MREKAATPVGYCPVAAAPFIQLPEYSFIAPPYMGAMNEAHGAKNSRSARNEYLLAKPDNAIFFGRVSALAGRFTFCFAKTTPPLAKVETAIKQVKIRTPTRSRVGA